MNWDDVTVLTKKGFPKGGTKKKEPSTAQKADTDSPEPPKKISASVSRQISESRQKLGLTRKQLASQINEKESVLGDYEQGKAVPNEAVLKKIEKALKIKIPLE
ncbi:MAG: transcriptional coactivator, multiprotein bridging factor Mbf1 [Amphiamblys sp. WSBS2006]|nr:MAG: transcriptional coactivator, multiprotein bridging factor Mbf1 [Amphiamblys sp. WSBS2006]